MSYNPNIPQASDLISQSQPQLLTNFSQLDTAFAVDHTAFSVASQQGQHKQVTLQAPLGSDPNQTTPIATIYSKASPTTTTSDLYYQSGVLSSNVVQLTGGGITAAAWCQFNGSTSTLNSQYNVASIVRNSAGNYTINFTRNFTGTNYVVLITDNGISTISSITYVSRSVSAFRFLLNSNQDATDINVVFFGTLA
jgi:hypothetical protein